MLTPFHLAIPVNDLEKNRAFYVNVLGCTEGRSDEKWVDLNLFGHQLVIHLDENHPGKSKSTSNPVDGHDVPIPHFGVVLQMEEWKKLAEKLISQGIHFVIEPQIRFKGKPGEQATMFFHDPAGNALEFKSFNDLGQLFAK